MTEKKCKCGYLGHSANDPTSPIEYSERTKKYSFKYSPKKNVYNWLYIDYCPSCGGRAPKSKKNIIPKKEMVWLQKLTKNISTIDDAIKILGKPDRDSTSRDLSWDSHSKIATINISGLGIKNIFIYFEKK